MKIEQYDVVNLKDGSEATIVEVFDKTHFLADIGSSPKDWDTIDITLNKIDKVIYHVNGKK